MVKIANDTPKELLEIGKKLHFAGTKEQVGEKVIALKNVAVKYVPIRTSKITYMNFDINAKFQPLANLISKLDFAQLSSMSRTIGLAFIKNYLQNNGFLK